MPYNKLLLRLSALFAAVGAILGSHMAGAGSLAFSTIHAHILLVGWLTLFSWSMFYKVYNPIPSLLTTLHVWSGIIGAFGLTIGMWLYYMNPFGLPEAFVTVFFIVGGTILLISFILFVFVTFRKVED
ncbi:hypothetical protein [Alkalibacillus salilacus]|uniref:Cytochrome-c oxidase n=1 Tax=Alkalibacillus salilacus TaxID=284582 RepID=A0ABT9VAZ8_9BACI|nr:hypothetical protein [Alkalibacillus salilacus]MDQ0158139.1 hypothetical protein [Alkalibacillus salilacus]